jgi:prepilin-type N-terminal cleavage/methylation domain-containing protein
MNKRGVTLVELIVVMVIIAIGAVLIAPNIGAWLPNYRLRSASRDIVSTMRTAQMKAISNNLVYRVSFNLAGAGSYILEYQNTLGAWISDGATQTLPSGVRVSSITLADNKAQFNPNSTSSTGSLTLSNSRGTQRTVSLTPSTGRIKIQ